MNWYRKTIISKKNIETIVRAAIRSNKSGKIYSGANHGIAFVEMEMKEGFQDSYESGFITSNGRFVSREEAGEIALKNKQLTWPNRAKLEQEKTHSLDSHWIG